MPDRVVGVSQKRLISWDFHPLQSLEITENGVKNKKRGKGDSKSKIEITPYNSGMQKSISEHATLQPLTWMGYSSRISQVQNNNKHLLNA